MDRDELDPCWREAILVMKRAFQEEQHFAEGGGTDVQLPPVRRPHA